MAENKEDYIVETAPLVFETREISFTDILEPEDKIPASGLLINQIRQWGLLNNLILVPVGDKYKVIAGRRRWDAMEKIRRGDKDNAADPTFAEKLAVKIVRLPEAWENKDLSLSAITLMENRARAENPLADALNIQKLLNNGVSHEEIKDLTGLIKAEQNLKLSLLQLLPEYIEMMKDGRMSEKLAFKVAKLKRDEQEKMLAIAEERWELEGAKIHKITHDDYKQVKLARRTGAADALFASLSADANSTEGIETMGEISDEEFEKAAPSWVLRARQQVDVLRIMLKNIENQEALERHIAEIEKLIDDESESAKDEFRWNSNN